MMLGNIQTHIFNYSRVSFPLGRGLGSWVVVGALFSHISHWQFLHNWVISVSAWWLKLHGSKVFRWRKLQSLMISFPFINGISRHQWSPVNICHRQSGQVRPKSLLMAAKFSMTKLIQSWPVQCRQRPATRWPLHSGNSYQCEHLATFAYCKSSTTCVIVLRINTPIAFQYNGLSCLLVVSVLCVKQALLCPALLR